MTILTGIVLTVALGAVAQRGDVFSEFGSRDSVAPRDDVAVLPSGGTWRLDVVANDAGATAEDGARLLVTAPPDCGAAWRMGAALAYEAGPGCAGTQRISYCLAEGDSCREAVVTVVLDPAAEGPGSATGTPPARRSAPSPAAAAVSRAGVSGFTVEGTRPAGRGGPLAAISAFGSLAPAEEDADAEAGGDDGPAGPGADGD